MTRDDKHLKGPYIVWINYGYEGWSPNSFSTLEDAVAWNRYGMTEFVITKTVSYTVAETEPSG